MSDGADRVAARLAWLARRRHLLGAALVVLWIVATGVAGAWRFGPYPVMLLVVTLAAVAACPALKAVTLTSAMALEAPAMARPNTDAENTVFSFIKVSSKIQCCSYSFKRGRLLPGAAVVPVKLVPHRTG